MQTVLCAYGQVRRSSVISLKTGLFACNGGLMSSIHKSVAFVRKIALMEGVSFLLLLGIAMPLKYLAGMPEAVRYAGWAHGVLFVLLVAALLRALLTTTWPLGRAALVFVASLLPLGPFLLDRRQAVWESSAE